jgi:hypothetical protein
MQEDNMQRYHDIEEIEVIEANMDDVFERYGGQKNVAFSHCISADFASERHMSAGVAVKFKKHFGRPNPQDYCDKHLTIQESPKGSVFSMVTKPQYYSKPNRSVYNAAFQELLINFKNRNFNQLVCSPMGCIRDNISIDLFATNIVNFQLATRAVVKIVTYNQTSHRVLRNGLPHDVFVKELKSAIFAEYERQKRNASDLQNSTIQNSTADSDTTPGITSSFSFPLSQADSESQPCTSPHDMDSPKKNNNVTSLNLLLHQQAKPT